MTVKKGGFPKTTIRRLMKDAGAGSVSKEAVEYMENMIKDCVREITGKALILMEHASRKTLMKRDLELTQMRSGQ